MKRLLLLPLLFLAGCVVTLQTTPDVNYWSYSGAADGSLVLTNPANPAGLLLRSGPLPIYNLPELVIDLSKVDCSGWNDILKFSRVVNMQIGHVVVKTDGRQKENAADFNNLCSNITIDRLELQEGQECALVEKGGCTDIRFGSLMITPGNGNCDVELGGISTESILATTLITATVNMASGKPVRLRLINVAQPLIFSGNVTQTW
jgi:hypothetical protein